MGDFYLSRCFLVLLKLESNRFSEFYKSIYFLRYQWKERKNPDSLSILHPSACRLNEIVQQLPDWVEALGNIGHTDFFVPDKGCPDGK